MRLTLVSPTRWIRSSATVAQRRTDPVSEDRGYRETVLMLVLQEAPLATIEELVAHHLAGQASDPAGRRDGIERAVADLAAIGVLNVEGRSVYASRAARETSRLVEGAGTEGGGR
jgi:hypothetical protein